MRCIYLYSSTEVLEPLWHGVYYDNKMLGHESGNKATYLLSTLSIVT